jgi:hypothetical protein
MTNLFSLYARSDLIGWNGRTRANERLESQIGLRKDENSSTQSDHGFIFACAAYFQRGDSPALALSGTRRPNWRRR